MHPYPYNMQAYNQGFYPPSIQNKMQIQAPPRPSQHNQTQLKQNINFQQYQPEISSSIKNELQLHMSQLEEHLGQQEKQKQQMKDENGQLKQIVENQRLEIESLKTMNQELEQKWNQLFQKNNEVSDYLEKLQIGYQAQHLCIEEQRTKLQELDDFNLKAIQQNQQLNEELNFYKQELIKANQDNQNIIVKAQENESFADDKINVLIQSNQNQTQHISNLEKEITKLKIDGNKKHKKINENSKLIIDIKETNQNLEIQTKGYLEQIKQLNSQLLNLQSEKVEQDACNQQKINELMQLIEREKIEHESQQEEMKMLLCYEQEKLKNLLSRYVTK